RSARNEVKVIKELLKDCVMQLDKNDVNLHELVDRIRDLVILIDTTSSSTKATHEGESLSTQINNDTEITFPEQLRGNNSQ
nr:hypothetical protein [Tanacetum cinerariifolium]